MALVDCVECSREFSDTRIDCPHCGAYLEGKSPNSAVAVDAELIQVVEERKYRKNILETLRSINTSKKLLTFKNGTLKDKRSVGFIYRHGEIISFNSYMDTNVEVEHTSINEVTGASSTSHLNSAEQTVSTSTTLSSNTRNVVKDVSVNRIKITEIAVKHNNGGIVKYFIRGSEIDFLMPGDPVTIGFLAINWEKHIQNVIDYPRYGITHENNICPIMLISRAIDAHNKSHYFANSSSFKNSIFNTEIGALKFSFIPAFILDLFIGYFPALTVISISIILFIIFKMNMGQKDRIKEYELWWDDQVSHISNIQPNE